MTEWKEGDPCVAAIEIKFPIGLVPAGARGTVKQVLPSGALMVVFEGQPEPWYIVPPIVLVTEQGWDDQHCGPARN